MTTAMAASPTVSSSLVASPANLATPAPSPTSPTLMSSGSASASPQVTTTALKATTATRRTQIARIGDERLRRSALLKRRHGLYKKATELATLCDCQIAILIFDSNDRLHHYSTTDNVDDVLLRYASHYRPALDVRTAREYNGSPDSGAPRQSAGTGTGVLLGGNVHAANPSTFVAANDSNNVSNLLGFSPSDPTAVDADAMMYNLVDDDGDDNDLVMVTSPIFTPASAPSDPFTSQPQPQMVLSESGAAFVQPVPLNRQLSGASRRATLGIPIPTPLHIPMGQSPLGGGALAMSPMSLPTQSPFFSAFDMMAINSPRVVSVTTPTAEANPLTRVPSTKKRRIDAVMHSDSAYVPNSPMFTPSLLASQPLPPLSASVMRPHASSGMSIDGTGSFTSAPSSWLSSNGSNNNAAAAGSMTPFQLPFTQTPTEMAADLMYSMPPSGTMPAAIPNSGSGAAQFMSPMMMASSGTPMQTATTAMMTPLTIPSDTFMTSNAAPFMSASDAGLHHQPNPPASTSATGPGAGSGTGGPGGPLRLPPTRSLSAVFPDISLSEYLHAHPPHPAMGDSGEALVGTLAWDMQAEVVPPAATAANNKGPLPSLPSAGAAGGQQQQHQFASERVMSLDLILNSFAPATSSTPGEAGPHPLQQAASIFDFGSAGAGGAGDTCAPPKGLVADPEDEVDLTAAPAAEVEREGEEAETEEERRRKNVLAWPLLG